MAKFTQDFNWDEEWSGDAREKGGKNKVLMQMEVRARQIKIACQITTAMLLKSIVLTTSQR